MGGVTPAAGQEDVKLRHSCRTALAPAPPPLSWQERRKRTAFMRSAAILAAIRCGLEARTPCLRAGGGSELPAVKESGDSKLIHHPCVFLLAIAQTT